MIGRTAIGGLALMTMACTATPPPEDDHVPVHGDTGYICDADPAQSLVGQVASSGLGARALELTGARSLRWIPPGTAVTMDYRPDRLNIELDAQNRVTALRCG